MTNPNNCETCDWKKHPDGGHCYMFRDAPTAVCMQHTGRRITAADLMGRVFGIPSCLIEDDGMDDEDRPY